MARDVGPIVPAEEVTRVLKELGEAVSERGRKAGEASLAEQKLVRRLQDRPDLVDQFVAEAQRALEDEIDLAMPTAGEDQIDPSELDREIAKKALARLKLPQLRVIAENTHLDPRGKEEEVIERIVQAYDVDAGEIARLVLSNEEAREERGITDRLFPIFDDSIDLSSAERLLANFVGRYIRTGIARWFVFEDLEPHPDFLFLHGVYRTYRVDAVGEDDDFDLNATPTVHPVRVRMDSGGQFVEVRSHGTTEGRSGLRAVVKLLGLRPSDGLPIETTPEEGELMRWDHRSVFLVDFLQGELDSDGIAIFNLTSAQFETGEEVWTDELRPTVRSVRFDGAHLLSSKSACELLVDGRGLVSISLLVQFRPNPNDSDILPIRISLERDHVVVITGFGTQRPEVARDLQRQIIRRLKRSLGHPLRDERQLEQLARRIRDRAQQEEPVDRADILGPENVSDDDEL